MKKPPSVRALGGLMKPTLSGVNFMSRNSNTGAPGVKAVAIATGSTKPEARPKDAGYLAHQAETLAQQLEILHVFAFQNPESCNPALAGAIGLALNAAASLSHELDVLEAAQ
ncbi:hypothetical protein I5R65_07585 [Herbaspirillum sp. AP02]|uniref:hypothetical protein n=1 Tax=unclassified Herbaspirillum TaxID=2624150 RepID=UPI0015D9AB86|nr:MULTISPECIES: hypothetical protein [unclassified Herbaspirillum]MBG7619321.1 hypothetical protein [Herbaspirillum sp. AP02]NZD66605.1 hypothetical protein [Herbaspirillum sp. AP21]